MEFEFDVKITPNILYDYMMHHTYRSLSGLLGAVTGALLLVAFGMNGHVVYLIAGLFILGYLPWTLFLKSRNQALKNPAFKEPLRYKMSEEGVLVSQGDSSEFQEWDRMFRATSTRNSIILYTSPVNASVFPRRDLGEKTARLVEMISTHMPPEKVKIRW